MEPSLCTKTYDKGFCIDPVKLTTVKNFHVAYLYSQFCRRFVTLELGSSNKLTKYLIIRFEEIIAKYNDNRNHISWDNCVGFPRVW